MIGFYMKCNTRQECVVEDGSTTAHPAITCSKLTIETLEQEVKYVQR